MIFYQPNLAANRPSAQREKINETISLFKYLNLAIKEHESENALKPAYELGRKVKIMKESEDLEEFRRKVNDILEKLTPTNFFPLVEEMKNLNINTEEKLNDIVHLIYEKAIAKPSFSAPCVNMCKQMALIKVPVTGHPDKQINFRKVLLALCQKEFERKFSDVSLNKSFAATETADPVKGTELQPEHEKLGKEMWFRQLGNVRFIGELFKRGMLIEPIIHECIRQMLAAGDEESLVCLCELLKSVSKELVERKRNTRKTNIDQARHMMNAYFTEMQNIVDKGLTSSYIRSMLQETIDLMK